MTELLPVTVMTAGADPIAQAQAPWGRGDVERWLVTGFREMTFRPIYAPGGNTLMSATPGKPSATFDIVAFAMTVLGAKSQECRAVLVWARSVAARESSKGDWSIAEFCRDFGWERRTFDRRRARACDRIALAKNIADGLQQPEKNRPMSRRAT